MSRSTPRIAPGTRREAGAVNWLIARIAGRATGGPPPNLFLTLGRTRGLFRGWMHFAGHLMPGGRIPRRDTELLILRVAQLRGSDYELHHHRRMARRVGVTDAEIERAAEGPAAAEWSERDRALLAAADAMVGGRDIPDATWQGLRRHLGERQAVEFCLLVGHYDMLATVIGTLRIQPDGSA